MFDALEQGFCSVEADIHLVGAELLIGHDPEDLRPGGTLEALYLDPLLERTRRFGGIYSTAQPRADSPRPPFTLLIDIKSDAESTWILLAKTLESYRAMLTEFHPDRVQWGAVTAFISGNRPRESLLNQWPRLAAMDGRLADLDSGASVTQIPIISDNWRLHFRWSGSEEFPQDQRDKLHALVRRVHEQGRLIRFWASPDRPEVWRELLRADVDYINTDDLSGLREFLLRKF